MSDAQRAKRERQRAARETRKMEGPDWERRYDRAEARSRRLHGKIARLRAQRSKVEPHRVLEIERFVEAEFDRLAVRRRHRHSILRVAILLPPTPNGMPDIAAAVEQRRRAA